MAAAIDSALRAAFERAELLRIDIERSRGLSQRWTVSSQRFTVATNRGWWNAHDWSRAGEEWTPTEEWKRAIVERFLLPFVEPRDSVLEIGPGGGRWTEILITRASRLFVVDAAETPLKMCRSRFSGNPAIVCVVGDGRTIPLQNSSIDSVWSYDVFVHVNPADTRSYFEEFARVLRAGGRAVIHHPGSSSARERSRYHRSDLTDSMVREFAAASGLDVIQQTTELVNEGDVLTVLSKR